jgi:hypothetical protein
MKEEKERGRCKRPHARRRGGVAEHALHMVSRTGETRPFEFLKEAPSRARLRFTGRRHY